ncbi:TBC domain-containing protein kinase-like protein, partial [Armadillidium vulgare]
ITEYHVVGIFREFITLICLAVMYPVPRKLGNAHLGVSTFFASSHPSESCGSNGLPLTPNSIRIYGRARMLNLINHPHLCTYIDVFRGKHERIIVVQEYYELNLKSVFKHYKVFRNEKKIISLIHEILQGLVYLNRFGTVCHNLSPETILIDPRSHVKLFDYGLYYMTEAGSSISFFIGKPKYLPPEILINFHLTDGQQPCTASGSFFTLILGNPSCDSWSIGFHHPY